MQINVSCAWFEHINENIRQRLQQHHHLSVSPATRGQGLHTSQATPTQAYSNNEQINPKQQLLSRSEPLIRSIMKTVAAVLSRLLYSPY